MPKKQFENDSKTLEQLKHLGKNIKNQLQDPEEEDLTFDTQVRSRSNVEYDEEEGRLALGDSYSTRKFLN
ncbi:MAG: hypothetical protein BRC26_02490, partial [Nanohaloarchaea archaeon QH_8_44_6]